MEHKTVKLVVRYFMYTLLLLKIYILIIKITCYYYMLFFILNLQDCRSGARPCAVAHLAHCLATTVGGELKASCVEMTADQILKICVTLLK